MNISNNNLKQNDLIRAKVPDRYEYIINPELSQYDMYKRAKERDAAECEVWQKGKTDAEAAKVTPQ